MAWPKGKPRKPPLPATEVALAESFKRTNNAPMREVAEAIDAQLVEDLKEPEPPQYPPDWHVGQLLNVRNTGPDYTITLWPEEADPRKPERALHFTNPGECQNFVSRWYRRQSHDPRAR